ncbi:MAG: MurR/RpiR family transcriptional regulator, partial [Cellulosilyticaceae bacterium]
LTDSVEVMADKVLYRHLFALQETKKLLDEAILDDCVTALIQAKTVYLFGIGASYLVAEDFHYKMMRVGKLCILCKDYDLQSLQADNMTEEDVAVVFSYSGQTKEMVRCCEKIHARGITIIAMTQVGASPVADLSTYRLYVASKEVLIRSGAMSSRIAQLYMIDMLYSRYICRERDRAYKHIQQTQLYKEGAESL